MHTHIHAVQMPLNRGVRVACNRRGMQWIRWHPFDSAQTSPLRD